MCSCSVMATQSRSLSVRSYPAHKSRLALFCLHDLVAALSGTVACNTLAVDAMAHSVLSSVHIDAIGWVLGCTVV
jgi:hypothetical protein